MDAEGLEQGHRNESLHALLPTEQSVKAAQVPEPERASSSESAEAGPGRHAAGAAGGLFPGQTTAKAARSPTDARPDAEQADVLVLMQIYQEGKSGGQIHATAEKVVARIPRSAELRHGAASFGRYAQKGDLNKASEYAGKVVAAFGTRSRRVSTKPTEHEPRIPRTAC